MVFKVSTLAIVAVGCVSMGCGDSKEATDDGAIEGAFCKSVPAFHERCKDNESWSPDFTGAMAELLDYDECLEEFGFDYAEECPDEWESQMACFDGLAMGDMACGEIAEMAYCTAEYTAFEECRLAVPRDTGI